MNTNQKNFVSLTPHGFSMSCDGTQTAADVTLKDTLFGKRMYLVGKDAWKVSELSKTITPIKLPFPKATDGADFAVPQGSQFEMKCKTGAAWSTKTEFVPGNVYEFTTTDGSNSMVVLIPKENRKQWLSLCCILIALAVFGLGVWIYRKYK
jgi:hypothetical protein